MLRQAVDGLSQKLGADDIEDLARRDNLAVAYADAGRLAEAIALFEETLKLQTSKLGADHPGTLRTPQQSRTRLQARGPNVRRDRAIRRPRPNC